MYTHTLTHVHTHTHTHTHRSRETESMEYLKNVIMHYMCADSTGRDQMISPIATVLHFSPEEVKNSFSIHVLVYCHVMYISGGVTELTFVN